MMYFLVNDEMIKEIYIKLITFSSLDPEVGTKSAELLVLSAFFCRASFFDLKRLRKE